MNNSSFSASKDNIFFKVLFLVIISFALLPICTYAADDIVEDIEGNQTRYERRECTLNLITNFNTIPVYGDDFIMIESYTEEGYYDTITLYPSDWNSSITVGYMWDNELGYGHEPMIMQRPSEFEPSNYTVFIDTHEFCGEPFGGADTYNVYIEITEKMAPWLYVDADGQCIGNFCYGDYYDEYNNDVSQNFEPGTLVLGGNSYRGDISYDVETDEYGTPSEIYEREEYIDKYGDMHTIIYDAPWDCYHDNIKKIVLWGNIRLTRNDYASAFGQLQYNQLEKFDVITGRNYGDILEYSAEDGVLYNSDKTTLIKYPCKKADKKFTVQDNVTEIAAGAFENNCCLEEISIQSEIQYINEGTFQGCTSLNNVVLPETLTTIRNRAFQGCTSLHNIILPETVTTIAYSAFRGCASLSNITLPKGLKAIDSGTFQDCIGLNNIVLPETLTSIYSWAFEGCTSLSNIVLPETLTSIYSGAFEGCTSLSNIVLPETLTTIYSNAFQGCTSLSNITLPKGLKKIDSGTFRGCIGLNNIVLPETLLAIDMYAFQGCTNLCSINIPETVKRINDYAFSDCKNLASLIIPQNVSYISPCAFDNCVNLCNLSIDENNQVYCVENGLILSKDKTILISYLDSNTEKECALPQYITVIGERAFAYNDNLNKIKLPYNIQTIEEGAFIGCSNLLEIIVPKNLKKVEKDSFYNCTNLNKIYYEGSVYDWIDISITENNSRFCNANKTYNYITTYSSYISKNGVILVNITLPDAIPDTARILVSSYSSANTFSEFGSYLEKQEDNSITYLLNSKDVSSIKIFVWDSLENLSPITYFEEICINSEKSNL